MLAHGAVDLESEDEADVCGQQREEEGGSDDDDDVCDDASRDAHNGQRQATLREAFDNPGPTRRRVDGAERIARLEEINQTLSAFRTSFLAEDATREDISRDDWPPSLRRLLKEAQQLSRTLQADGYSVAHTD